MKLAAMYRESDGYPLDDPPVVVAMIANHVVTMCGQHQVEAIGELSCAMAEDRFTGDRALRWEFATNP